MPERRTSKIGIRPGAQWRALTLAVSAIAVTTGSIQATPLKQTARANFAIPAGNLNEALAAFGRQTGLQVTYVPGVAASKSSPGASGALSSGQALGLILRGTGLTYHFLNATTVSITEAAPIAPIVQGPGQPNAVQLETISVEGRGATTEGTGSYTSKSLDTATLLPLSLRETPQSVTVITRQRIDDQNLIKARDVFINTPGISITATAPYREGISARGFNVTNLSFDGLPVTVNSSRQGMFLNDMAMYDRVEVVRGSTGLTQGVGNPSAAVNFIRKRPTHVFQADIQGEAGSWNYHALQADISGPVHDNIRLRAVGRWHESDSFMDVVDEKRLLGFLIGEVDITSNILLTLSVSNQKNDNKTSYGGLPTAPDGSDLHLPRSTYLGNRWNHWDDETTNLFGTLEQRLGAGWSAKFSYSQNWGDQDQLRTGVRWDGDNQWWVQNAGDAQLVNKRTNYDLQARGPVFLFGREHDLVVGASARTADENQTTAGYYEQGVIENVDIYNWGHNAPRQPLTTDYYQSNKERQYGIYGAANIKLTDSLKLIAGLRLNWFRSIYSDRTVDWDTRSIWSDYNNSYSYNNHLTKYAGLVFDLSENHSIYTSYTDIFNPQDARDTSNNFIRPILGKNYEFGVKSSYFNGALNTSLALYRIDQANMAVPVGACPFNPMMTCYTASGLVRSQGIDAEIQGALTPELQVSGGYTYVVTNTLIADDPTIIGQPMNTGLPRHQLKFTATYRVPGDHWRIGGNIRWQSNIWHWDNWLGFDYYSRQPSYYVVDAMLGYKYDDNLDLQLNINNVFDRRYYSSINNQPVDWGGNAVYGPPRQFMGKVRYRF